MLRSLGPGIVTGAADDDPSGIATYSVAGAQLGTSLLWTAILTWPLMATVQFMCARVGMVSGGGLTRALRQKLPRPVLMLIGVALLAANTINIGADLGGMADAAVDLVGGSALVYAIGFGAAIAAITVLFSYPRFSSIMKWLAVSLVAYIVTAFITRPDWSAVWHDVVVPHWPDSSEAWSTLVALLGTTISPYLFFWQSSQEVEEEKCAGRKSLPARAGATRQELFDRKVDVGLGTLFSNSVMFFIMLSCAMTLHRTGVTQISSAHDAAVALRPVAGNFATVLYAVGVVGVGMLAIPTLAGSSAYVFAETWNWPQGLNETFGRARRFYVVLLVSMAGGIAFTFFHFNPVKALYWTAVINGTLAPFLLVGLLWVARDHRVMKGQPSSRLSQALVAATVLIMGGAAVAMFVV